MRPTRVNQPHSLPLAPKMIVAIAAPKGFGAADKACEAPPSLSQAVYQQPCLFCSSTVPATPFPRKSRHRSDGKRLPQSTSPTCLRA